MHIILRIEFLPLLEFTSCLLHCINYQFLDFQNFKTPVMLSRYTHRYTYVRGYSSLCHLYAHQKSNSISFAYRKTETIMNETVCYTGSFPADDNLLITNNPYNLKLKLKYSCLVQLYLYPVGLPVKVTHVTPYDIKIPPLYFDLGYYQNPFKDEFSPVTSRKAYRIVVTGETINDLSWDIFTSSIKPHLRHYPATYWFHAVINSQRSNRSNSEKQLQFKSWHVLHFLWIWKRT